MIHVIASIYVKEDRLSDFVTILKSNVPNVLKEEGCIEYLPTVDVPSGLSSQAMDKNVVIIIEKWRSLDDLLAHMSAPHMLAYKKKVKELVDKVFLKVLAKL